MCLRWTSRRPISARDIYKVWWVSGFPYGYGVRAIYEKQLTIGKFLHTSKQYNRLQLWRSRFHKRHCRQSDLQGKFPSRSHFHKRSLDRNQLWRCRCRGSWFHRGCNWKFRLEEFVQESYAQGRESHHWSRYTNVGWMRSFLSSDQSKAQPKSEFVRERAPSTWRSEK